MDRQLDRFDQRGSHQRGSLIVVMVIGIVVASERWWV